MTQDEIIHRAYDLAEDHWKYIEELLWAHGEKVGNIDIAKFHYKEAFKHGYKHAWEDTFDKFTFPYYDANDLSQSTSCNKADKK